MIFTALAILQLNFAKYRRAGRFAFKMMPPGKVQVAGFSNADTHLDVINKGARGLGVDASPRSLSLLISSGLVLDNPLASGEQWTLGGYMEEFGGPQVRGKRTFGVVVPPDEEEQEEDEDQGRSEVKHIYNYVSMHEHLY